MNVVRKRLLSSARYHLGYAKGVARPRHNEAPSVTRWGNNRARLHLCWAHAMILAASQMPV
jgi:hypothetical protein